MAHVSYLAGSELPDLSLTWYDSNDALIDFTSLYTFTVKIGVPGSTASVTKTTGITGAATSPNVTVAWTTSELSSLTAGSNYAIQVIARRTADSKDRAFPAPISLTVQPAIL